MALDILTCSTKVSAIQRTQQLLTSLVNQLLNQELPVLLMLSGGSSGAVAAQMDLAFFSQPHLDITVLDERYSSEFELNNSLQLTQLEIPLTPQVPQAGETLVAFAHRFDRWVADWIRDHPTGKIVALLGVGADGHIAGISPFFDEAAVPAPLKSDNLVVGYSGHLSPPERVTVTPHFITTVLSGGVVFSSGEHKQQALAPLLTSDQLNPTTYPLHLLVQHPVTFSFVCDYEID